MKEMKLNAVKNLMQSLEFNREDKEALLRILQQELGVSGSNIQQSADKFAQSQEYGPQLPMEILFSDGSTGWRQDKSKKTVGIVIRAGGRKFALYAKQHSCPDNARLSTAISCASELPKVNGRSWRLLTVKDCYAIKNRFCEVNLALEMVGCRQIIESNRYGVLTSDESMAGATGWQVWYAIDF